jgi:hypothetical protein
MLPFFDETLAERVADAEAQWIEEAEALVDERIDAEELADIEAEAADALDERPQALADSVGELPAAVVPPAHMTLAKEMAQGKAVLADTDFDWELVTLALKAHKSYGGDAE